MSSQSPPFKRRLFILQSRVCQFVNLLYIFSFILSKRPSKIARVGKRSPLKFVAFRPIFRLWKNIIGLIITLFYVA